MHAYVTNKHTHALHRPNIMYTHAHPHTPPHTHTHTHTHTYTRTHTHTHMHTHIHTHTHTHTLIHTHQSSRDNSLEVSGHNVQTNSRMPGHPHICSDMII